MSLMRGRLFAGALFVGALFGPGSEPAPPPVSVSFWSGGSDALDYELHQPTKNPGKFKKQDQEIIAITEALVISGVLDLIAKEGVTITWQA